MEVGRLSFSGFGGPKEVENEPLEDQIKVFKLPETNKPEELGIKQERCGLRELVEVFKREQLDSANSQHFSGLGGFQSSLKLFSNLGVNNVTIKTPHGDIEDVTFPREVVQGTCEENKLTFLEELKQVLDKKSILSSQQLQQLRDFLVKHRGNFSEVPGCSDVEVHHINTGNHYPVHRSPYPETPAKQKIIKEEVNKMLELGLIEPSYSSWSSPVTLVKKTDGSNRFCVDYRALNKITESDQFPMPHMASIVHNLRGAKYLSSIDLTMGYHQIMVAEEDRKKTAFTCSEGLFQFRVLPFGLKTAPNTFNRLMSKVLNSVKNECALFYLDDILIYSVTFDQHLKDLEKVFGLLKEANLFIKFRKSQFCRLEFKFLGSIIRDGEIHLDPGKIESIKTFKRPSNMKEVQRFLGMTGWLRKHVSNYAEISRPLSKLTAGKNPKKYFKWTQECQTAFQQLQWKLMEPGTALVLPNFDRPFIIESDASDHGIGGVLCQKDENGNTRVIEYASRVLKTAENHYTITEKECLSLIFCITKFRPYIADRHFTAITDHNALRWLLKTKDLNGRLTRWALRLQEYDYTIEYRKGSENLIADALSRGTTIEPDESPSHCPDQGHALASKPAVNLVGITINLSHTQLDQVKLEQGKEDWIMAKIYQIDRKKNGETQIVKNYHLIKGILYYKNNKKKKDDNFRLVIPRKLVYKILEELHTDPSGGHYGIDKTIEKIKKRTYWHKMEQDITLFVQMCEVCQLTKHTNQILKGPMMCNFVDYPMQLLGVDIVGPLPRSIRQNKYMLVLVDHYSKWLEVFPMRNSTVNTIVGHLTETFGRYGIPERLLSDNGPQFLANIYKKLCEVWNVKEVHTSFYHPAGNFVERTNKTIKRLIRSYIDENQQEWDRHIPQFLLAVRSTVNTTTGFTPARLFLGREAHLPWDPIHKIRVQDTQKTLDQEVLDQQAQLEWIKDQVRENMEKEKEHQKKQYDKHTKERHFNIGDLVKLRTFPQSDATKKFAASLSKPWRGPVTVTEKISDLVYRLKDRDGKDLGKWNIENIERFHMGSTIVDRGTHTSDPLPVDHTHPYNTRSRKKRIDG